MDRGERLHSVGETHQTGYLLNVSETGSFLHTKFELPTGAMIRLKFALPGTDRLIDLKGIAKWSTSEIAKKTLFGGYGIMFTSVSDADLEVLRDFISNEAKKIGLHNEEPKGG